MFLVAPFPVPSFNSTVASNNVHTVDPLGAFSLLHSPWGQVYTVYVTMLQCTIRFKHVLKEVN